MPAPAKVEDIASPEVMRHLVPALARYYDHVLVDCPAGLGRGFESAAATASRALVVSTPDPVCLRNSSKAGLALAQHGIAQTRLVVNRFSGAEFVRQNVFHNLDEAIDMAGSRGERTGARPEGKRGNGAGTAGGQIGGRAGSACLPE